MIGPERCFRGRYDGQYSIISSILGSGSENQPWSLFTIEITIWFRAFGRWASCSGWYATDRIRNNNGLGPPFNHPTSKYLRKVQLEQQGSWPVQSASMLHGFRARAIRLENSLDYAAYPMVICYAASHRLSRPNRSALALLGQGPSASPIPHWRMTPLPSNFVTGSRDFTNSCMCEATV